MKLDSYLSYLVPGNPLTAIREKIIIFDCCENILNALQPQLFVQYVPYSSQ